MRVTVVVSRDLADQLRKETESKDRQYILQVLQDLGVTMQPLFLGEIGPDLLVYFAIDVPNENKGKEVITRLRESEGIAAAYIKPRAELAHP